MENKYSIRVAAELSGLTTLVIRAWENRYNAISPERTSGKHRLYSTDDIKKLKLLSSAIKSGSQISRIANLSIKELEERIRKDNPSTPNQTLQPDTPYVEQCKQALRDLDSRLLEEIIIRAEINMGSMKVIDLLIVPLMNEIGEGWYKGEWRILHEHIISAVIRTYLGNKLSSYESSETSLTAIVSTPIGQKHDLGASAIALAAASAGFRVLFLGAQTPAEEIVRTAEESNAKLVLFSIVFPGSVSTVKNEIKILKKFLPENCSLLIGGTSAKKFLDQQSIIPPENLQALREWMLDFHQNENKE